MRKEDIGEGTYPGCGRKLKVPFPYNVDLSRNDVVVICSGCGLHSRINFVIKGWGFDKMQAIFRPPYKPEVPTLEELKKRER